MTAHALAAPAADATALPVIDLSELNDPQRHADFHARLARIARDTGFFYLEGHGIDTGLIRRVEQLTRAVFALPASAKERIAIRNTPHFRGYTGVGGELTRLQPDLREQLDLAERTGLPVVLHCVRAFEPLMKELQGRRLKAVIFHGFIGSPQQLSTAPGFTTSTTLPQIWQR